MTPASGAITTICYCSHHVLDHGKASDCQLCPCPGFVAKAALPWRPDDPALVPVIVRYERQQEHVKEDIHG